MYNAIKAGGGGRMPGKILTEAEERIMDVLWEQSPRTMMEIGFAGYRVFKSNELYSKGCP